MMKNFVKILIYFILFCSLTALISCEISDKRQCADPECKTLLSLAKTLIRYQSAEDGVLSFPINKEVRVFSKSAGSNPQLWGVEVQGQRGYVNKDLIREYRVFVKPSDLVHEVPTELETLKERRMQKDKDKLKSSEVEEPSVEATTTAPLPVPVSDSIVTDSPNLIQNSGIVAGGPSKVRTEVIDGTTVLIPIVAQIENEIPVENVQVPPLLPTTSAPEATNNVKDTEDIESEENDESIDVEDEEEEILAEDDEDDEEFQHSHEETTKQAIADTLEDKSSKLPFTGGGSNIEMMKIMSEREIPPFKPVPDGTLDFLKAQFEDNSQNENPTIAESNVEAKAITETLDENVPDQATNNSESPLNVKETEPGPATESQQVLKTESQSDNVTASNTDGPDSMQDASSSNTLTSDKTNDTMESTTVPNQQKPDSASEDIALDGENLTTSEKQNVPNPIEDLTTKQESVPSSSESPSIPPLLHNNHQDHSHIHVPGDLQGHGVKDNRQDAVAYENTADQLGLGKASSQNHDHLHAHEHGIGMNAPETPGSVHSHHSSNQATTPTYDDHNIPNPLDIETNTQTVKPDVATAPGLEPELTTESPLPSTGASLEAKNEPRASIVGEQQTTAAIDLEVSSVPETPTTTEDPHSAEDSATTPTPEVKEEKQEEIVPSPGNTINLVETPDTNEIQTEPITPQTDPVPEVTSTKGLFDTIIETVNSFWPQSKSPDDKAMDNFDEALDRLLFPDKEAARGIVDDKPTVANEVVEGFCENLTPGACPKQPKFTKQWSRDSGGDNSQHSKDCLCENDYISLTMEKFYEMTDLIIYLSITALTLLIFSLGYYCTANGRKENSLVSKLNVVERSLLASNKEANILKHDLSETLNKLASIEDNSFGSNDMVIALKKELDESEYEKDKLIEQIAGLEKELENAAEAGLELNKMVSDLLSNQSGDDSIISSVEELQKQLNEQQNTIFEINSTLAEKSRENSELQMLISELNSKYQEQIENFKAENETLLTERNALQSQVTDARVIFDGELDKVVAMKNEEIEKLSKDLSTNEAKCDELQRKYHSSEARVEALEESLQSIKKNPNVNIKELLQATDSKAEILSLQKERDSLKEKLEREIEARKLLEDNVKIVNEDISSIKQEYSQAEKEKLEAQTRLDVLSSYFKEKETQLQKELSIKEAMWMKQQGETTSTVERVRLMQDEIQALKSQNDSLRAEIEAQVAAHKIQITAVENRAHETWLAARQADRKLEEARAEASTLRRKLTTLAGNPLGNDIGLQNKAQNAIDGLSNHDINQAPSPILMETPGSPILGGLPPPPPFLPPPFMGPPPPFMSMPPPFIPPGEMRPPPLGRLMSPPPPPANRYSPSLVDDRDRYSPPNGRYSPGSRYNYNTDLISTYDTETDFSPPPSPHGRSRGGGSGDYSSPERERDHDRARERDRDRDRDRVRDRDRDRDRDRNRDRNNFSTYSPPPNSDRSKKTKGGVSSGSVDSYDSRKVIRSKGKGKNQ